MCGFGGEITFDGSTASLSGIERMLDALAPRGPDGVGTVHRGRVALGHRRLSIIDLSDAGQQPMTDPALGLDLVFNGCIYNHAELRAELEAKGYRFFSTSDTEVVLKAHHAWGPEAPTRFHGMFAYVVHERDGGCIWMARDRFGIKPLYHTVEPGRLRFASTLPALLAAGGVDTAIDPEALHSYMSFHAVVPPPRTILEGVRKLPVATIRRIEPDGTIEDRRYWDVSFERSREDEERGTPEWEDMLLDAMRRAVSRRMVADVPVGVLLSGGVDSSLIVGLLAEAGQEGLRTFSIGFEAANGEKGDEFAYSDLVARHFATDHIQRFVPSSELQAALPAAISAMSEPMVSYDNIGFFLLSREVSRHVKVVQSGQGADEVFAGYHWYPKLDGSNDPLGDYSRAFFDRDHQTMGRHLGARWMNGDVSREIVAAHFARTGAPDPVDKALRLDTEIMLADDPVKRVDNMTMAWGLEARVPFLDHELVELAARMPSRIKLADGGKGVLKSVARRVVPREVIDRPKGYFPVPALKYLDGPFLEMARDALTSQAARERGLFREDYLDALFGAPAEHITPLRGSELWQCALLELWLQDHGI
ncbi:N-acetylglutaminylglutamine amidotransferase [Limibaculum sp. M0105]|uniref:asparagine synthase (glutamine-hydrolyzing) n=1 Tax=Thermohalobaculum xanthum TaxID=2753746 RepID=A0A8J7M7I4_9RHOB|nr:N-acetylglutaminylglutamine amidotransferase [Thermohalobaculum xanthum]MBK0399794.1 N-acetylglutaminylglutamine amidotransferase [Thermohalobaculum xanthum]